MSNEPRTFRKNPVEIQAMQWTGGSDNAYALTQWMGSSRFTQLHGSMREGSAYTAQIWVQANEEWLRIQTGEWVIRDSKGFYPCKADVFAETYAEVSR
jgi:hypothetical protein